MLSVFNIRFSITDPPNLILVRCEVHVSMLPELSPVVRLFPLIELDEGRTVGVKIRQAGREEVRLDAQIPLETGTVVVLRIEDEQGDIWFRAASEIHWSHAIPGGASVGLYLGQPLTDQLLTWPDWDRRESLRYSLDLPVKFWWQGSTTAIPARLANYSVNGLGIVCPERVILGRQAVIAAGSSLQDIVCVSAVPCWQVETSDGVMIGFELPEGEGKRFGGHLHKPVPLKPNDPSGSTPKNKM